jgi:hypothetical protein
MRSAWSSAGVCCGGLGAERAALAASAALGWADLGPRDSKVGDLRYFWGFLCIVGGIKQRLFWSAALSWADLGPWDSQVSNLRCYFFCIVESIEATYKWKCGVKLGRSGPVGQ